MSTFYEYITDDEKLKKHHESIKAAKLLAFDSEFISDANSYYPRLSIIQLSYKDKVLIIDMMNDEEYHTLKCILLDKEICKIIHSPSQDVLAVFARLNCHIYNIFDSQLAYSFISGERNIAYQKLVRLYLNEEVDKEEQVSCWQVRPLTKKQLDYAARDVLHLEVIYNRLSEQIRSEKKGIWFKEECLYLENTYRAKIMEPGAYIQTLFRNFSGKIDDSITYILLKTREIVAAKLDIFRKAVITDDKLYGLSKMLTKSQKVEGLSSQHRAKLFRANLKLNLLAEFMSTFETLSQKAKKEEFEEVLTYLELKQKYREEKKSKNFHLIISLVESKACRYNMSKDLIASKEELAALCILSEKSCIITSPRLQSSWRKKLFINEVRSILKDQRGKSL